MNKVEISIALYKQFVNLRKTWEGNSKVILELATMLDDYGVVYILVEDDSDSQKSYRVLRYFKSGGKWVVSVDKNTKDISEALKNINESFNEIYCYVVEKST